MARPESVLRRVAARVKSLPPQLVGISAGLFTLGVTIYAFLLIAGQVLGDEKYAPLGALWILVFLLGPGFFAPVEQELGRAIAARHAHGQGAGPVIRRAAILTVVLTFFLAVAALATAGLLNGELFNDQPLLTVALVASLFSYALEYVARGIFAGNRQLNAYGVMIGAEGVVRVLLAVVLVVVGVDSAGPYGLLIGIGPLLAVAIAMYGKKNVMEPGPHANWSELSVSLGNLIAASLLSQILANSAPLVVKYMASPSQQALAGAFTKAFVIARIPVFLFQAVQAAVLPRLSHHAATGDRPAFERTFRFVMVVVAAIGFIGVVGTAVLGNLALSLFGSDIELSRWDLTLLAVGNGLFLLCMTVAQALVAVEAQARTVAGWATGVLVFAAALALPGEVVRKVEVALVIGSAASLVLLSGLLRHQLTTKGVGPIRLDLEADETLIL